MLAELYSTRKDHPMGDLYALRRALLNRPLGGWPLILQTVHPVAKMKMMYKLKDKHDAILTKYFLGAKQDHYFDYTCMSIVDSNLAKLDMAFIELVNHLTKLARMDKFSPERMEAFDRAVIKQFTLRNYSLEDHPKSRSPEDVIIHNLTSNGFVDWHLRSHYATSQRGRFPNQVMDLVVLTPMRKQLVKLLYTLETPKTFYGVLGAPKVRLSDQERYLHINPSAYKYLLMMSMTEPGKLFNFLN